MFADDGGEEEEDKEEEVDEDEDVEKVNEFDEEVVDVWSPVGKHNI